ncbi:MAG TPA: hypothetical protein VF395_10815, partial [Polyangiaceae bacterium]
MFRAAAAKGRRKPWEWGVISLTTLLSIRGVFVALSPPEISYAMHRSLSFMPRSALFLLIAAALVPACG